MKRIFSVCVFFLMLGVAAAQQSTNNSPVATNGVASSTIEEIKAKAEKGDAQAQFQLGFCYCIGKGVTTNYTESIKWIRKSADQGFAEAEYILGVAYIKGDLGLLPQNESEAVKWYRKAAEQGLADAQYNLGLCYADGTGTTIDNNEAAKWYLKAAEQGNADAQCMIGTAFRLGKGVAENYTEAAKWFSRAASQGDTVAEVDLGMCYESGTGVPKNNVEAYKWFNLAAAHPVNNDKEKELIDSAAILRDSMVKSGITPEEIAEAQQLSAAFVPKKETLNSASPDNPFASGSGFFITDDGYLISNYHVVKGATKVRLVTSAGTVDAKVVQVDAANDLALLKADGKFSPLPVATSRSAHLGGTVATIGFPDPSLQGFSPKLAKGEIASLSGAGDDPRYFQISVPVQPGNSGGALVDEHGNVIGIVSAKLDASVAFAASGALPENVNYAVKSSLLLSFLESVPDVDAKLKAPNTKDESFEQVVQSAQDAAVLVLVY